MSKTPERPTGPKPLERAPGERYRGGTPPGVGGASSSASSSSASSAARPAQPATPTGSARRGVLAAVGMAVAVAVARALVGQLDLGPGTLAIAAFGGWLTALALVWGAGGAPVTRRGIIAAVAGGGAIALGLVLESLVARLGTGVLGPIDYVNARYGLLAYIEIALAAAVAGIRAR